MKSDNAKFFDALPENMNMNIHNAKAVYLSICQSVFEDGKINWGRVYTVLALAATLAVYFTEKGLFVTVGVVFFKREGRSKNNFLYVIGN